MRILALQHHDLGSPGRLGSTLRDLGHRIDILRPDLGDSVPTSVDEFHAVIALGGPQNIDEHAADPSRWPWLDREIALIRDAHSRAIPVIGICLGHQLIAAALGGEVSRMAAAQIGFHPTALTVAAHTDPIFAGVPWSSHQFCVNGREVTRLPAGAAPLAASPLCKVMAFRAGMRSYGFQFHFECDRPSIDAYLKDERAHAGPSATDHYPAFERIAERLCDNLATYLFPPTFRDRARKDMAEGSAAVSGAR